jgi:hypothetical protein
VSVPVMMRWIAERRKAGKMWDEAAFEKGFVCQSCSGIKRGPNKKRRYRKAFAKPMTAAQIPDKQPGISERPTITAKGAARIMNCSVQKVWMLCTKDQIPHFHCGNRRDILFRKSDIELFQKREDPMHGTSLVFHPAKWQKK